MDLEKINARDQNSFEFGSGEDFPYLSLLVFQKKSERDVSFSDVAFQKNLDVFRCVMLQKSQKVFPAGLKNIISRVQI